MNERRAGYRIENQELSADLCLVRVLLCGGRAFTAKVCNLNGKGIRLVFSSDDSPVQPEDGETVKIVFNYAGLDLAAKCVYLETMNGGLTAMGAIFSNALESAILSRYLLSAVRCRVAV